MKNKKNLLITIIIPVYNDRKQLKLCLQAISHQTLSSESFDVIIIDNGSTDNLTSIINKYENVTFIKEPIAGSYIARNKGISCVKSNYIAFTDSDCIPDPAWLERGLTYLQKSSDIGLVGGKIQLFYKNNNHLTFAEIYEKHTAFHQRRYIEKYHFAATANMFTQMDIFDKVGLFNEDLKSSGDKEWGNRVFNKHYKLAYVENIIVKHPARSTLKELFSKNTRVIGGSEALRKNKGLRYIIDYDLLNGIIPQIAMVKHILSSDSKYSEKLICLSIIISLNFHSTLIRLYLRLGGRASR